MPVKAVIEVVVSGYLSIFFEKDQVDFFCIQAILKIIVYTHKLELLMLLFFHFSVYAGRIDGLSGEFVCELFAIHFQPVQ